jgi:hypothetical protein
MEQVSGTESPARRQGSVPPQLESTAAGFPAAGHRDAPAFATLGALARERIARTSVSHRQLARESGSVSEESERRPSADALAWQHCCWRAPTERSDAVALFSLSEVFLLIRSEYAPQSVYGWLMLTHMLRMPPETLAREAVIDPEIRAEQASVGDENRTYGGFLELVLFMHVGIALRDALHSRNRNVNEAALECLAHLLHRLFDSDVLAFVDGCVFEDDKDQIGDDYNEEALIDLWASMELRNDSDNPSSRAKHGDNDNDTVDEDAEVGAAGSTAMGSNLYEDYRPTSHDWVIEMVTTGLVPVLLGLFQSKLRQHVIDPRVTRLSYFLIWVLHPCLRLDEGASILKQLLSIALALLERVGSAEPQQTTNSETGPLAAAAQSALMHSLRAAAVLAMDERLDIEESVQHVMEAKLQLWLNHLDLENKLGRQVARSMQALVSIMTRNRRQVTSLSQSVNNELQYS